MLPSTLGWNVGLADRKFFGYNRIRRRTRRALGIRLGRSPNRGNRFLGVCPERLAGNITVRLAFLRLSEVCNPLSRHFLGSGQRIFGLPEAAFLFWVPGASPCLLRPRNESVFPFCQ